MHLDVTTMMGFYNDDPLGAVVRRLLVPRLTSRWRSVGRDRILGLGYATPLLTPFRDDADATLAFMPAAQGVVGWPRQVPFRSALIDDAKLPLPDSSVDRIVAMHFLEHCDRVRDVIAEAWRVLSPEGTLFIVAPNRRGAWASFDTSPFGHGRPYSRGQLEALLVEARFVPEYWGTALAMPPVRNRLVLRSAVSWERAGLRLWPALAGVVLVEARKTLRAPAGTAPSPVLLRQPAYVRGARTARTAGPKLRTCDATRDRAITALAGRSFQCCRHGLLPVG